MVITVTWVIRIIRIIRVITVAKPIINLQISYSAAGPATDSSGDRRLRERER